jgi:hypothetical protein
MRASITANNLVALDQLLDPTNQNPLLTNSVAGLQAVLALPQVAAVLFGQAPSAVNVWGGNDPNLPADWPADDPDRLHEYHVAFTYGGAAPLPVQFSPVPMIAWVAKGGGVGTGGGGTGGGGPQGPYWKWTDAGNQTPITDGTRVRISISPAAMSALAFQLQQQVQNPREFLIAFLAMPGWFRARYHTDATSNPPLTSLTEGAIWSPGAPLPADWPADEPSPGGNWHVEVIAHPSGPFLVQQLPVAMQLWTFVEYIPVHL